MKATIITAALLIAAISLQGQNFLFEITPQGASFRVLITDDAAEAFPRPLTDYGLLDSAAVRGLAYQLIEAENGKAATAQARTFLALLKAEQAQTAFNQVLALDYDEYINDRLAGSFDGDYAYQVRGTATNFNVRLEGSTITRISNSNQVGTFAAKAANWLAITSGGNTIQLYRSGNIFVGRNASGQVVTLKRI